MPISGPTLSKQSKFDNGPYWNLVAHHQAVISLHESSIYGTWYKILGPMLYKAITQWTWLGKKVSNLESLPSKPVSQANQLTKVKQNLLEIGQVSIL